MFDDVPFCGTGIRPIPPRPDLLGSVLLGGRLKLDPALVAGRAFLR